MKCALCGYDFAEQEGQTECPACPLSGTCNMLRCPNCGYDNPRASKLETWLGRWFRKPRRVQDVRPAPVLVGEAAPGGDETPSSLAALRPGQSGEIVQVSSRDSGRLQRLMAMGLLPGARFRLLRTFPAFVLQVGFTQIALDEDIARDILVRQ